MSASSTRPCMLGRIINVIKESELDQIATTWATICLAQLLSRRGGVEDTLPEGAVGRSRT